MTEHQVASAVLVLGATFAAWVTPPLFAALSSRTWPRAQGVVVDVASVHVAVTSSIGMGAWSALDPAISVEYEVAGQAYRTNRFRWTGSSIRQIRRAFDRYTPGARVEVIYDPRNPQRAVLDPSLSWEDLAPFVLGIAIAVGGLAWMLSTT